LIFTAFFSVDIFSLENAFTQFVIQNLHKIADLFMHRFSEYSDMADDNSNLNDREMRDCLLYACFLVLGRYIDLLEQAMKCEKIQYDKIIV
ncbi:MAG: hypothetical protein K2K57_09435, partial [Oscillospiraceae bacterium]|nr:hypothetical protein [Oscillospiraceae bacterium]